MPLLLIPPLLLTAIPAFVLLSSPVLDFVDDGDFAKDCDDDGDEKVRLPYAAPMVFDVKWRERKRISSWSLK